MPESSLDGSIVIRQCRHSEGLLPLQKTFPIILPILLFDAVLLELCSEDGVDFPFLGAAIIDNTDTSESQRRRASHPNPVRLRLYKGLSVLRSD